jgi:hypothetical protein
MGPRGNKGTQWTQCICLSAWGDQKLSPMSILKAFHKNICHMTHEKNELFCIYFLILHSFDDAVSLELVQPLNE